MCSNSLARQFSSMFHAKCLLPSLDKLLLVRSCLQNFYQCIVVFGLSKKMFCNYRRTRSLWIRLLYYFLQLPVKDLHDSFPSDPQSQKKELNPSYDTSWSRWQVLTQIEQTLRATCSPPKSSVVHVRHLYLCCSWLLWVLVYVHSPWKN